MQGSNVYTAVSRAREKVFIVGKPEDFAQAATTPEIVRITLLKILLTKGDAAVSKSEPGQREGVMAKPPRLTRTQKAILEAPRTELRRVSLIEKIANPERFSRKGEYFVPKTIKKVTSRTAFVTVSRKKDFAEGVSHSKAAAERAAAERSYKTAASEAQAGAARETFRLKRRVKVLDENARVSRPKYFKKKVRGAANKEMSGKG